MKVPNVFLVDIKGAISISKFCVLFTQYSKTSKVYQSSFFQLTHDLFLSVPKKTVVTLLGRFDQGYFSYGRLLKGCFYQDCSLESWSSFNPQCTCTFLFLTNSSGDILNEKMPVFLPSDQDNMVIVQFASTSSRAILIISLAQTIICQGRD